MRRLILRSHQSPGDILMLTAAVRDLHAANPGQFHTDVRTSCPALWEHNPHLTPLDEHDHSVETVEMHYPLIHHSNQRPYHFLHGYAQFLEQTLGVRVPLTRFRGDVYLADEERAAPLNNGHAPLPERFWIIVAGGKYDFTAKWWNPDAYQQVVDHFRGKIQFVQCGEAGHWHPRLSGVTDLIGKTTAREFVRLMHHADGVVCPVTFAMHLAAAVDTKPGRAPHRACVVIAGGREPPHWEAYPQHQFLSTSGALPCCLSGGCWKSRCQLVGDGDQKDRHNVCERPVQIRSDLRIPQCMSMITPEDVIRRIELYFEGGAYQYLNGSSQSLHPVPERRRPTPTGVDDPQAAGLPPSRAALLIEFRQPLSAVVELSIVLKHLKHYHSDREIDVAVPADSAGLLRGLCHAEHTIGDSALNGTPRDPRFAQWPDCRSAYTEWPSTRAAGFVFETLRLTPIEELCRYTVSVSPDATTAARCYLSGVARFDGDIDGRLPVVVLDLRGDASNTPVAMERDAIPELAALATERGYVPLFLGEPDSDFDATGSLRCLSDADDYWQTPNLSRGELMAALLQNAALFVGVCGAPLRLAAATSTHAIVLWTDRHPVHEFDPAPNVLHLIAADVQPAAAGPATLAYFGRKFRSRSVSDHESEILAAVAEALPERQPAAAPILRSPEPPTEPQAHHSEPQPPVPPPPAEVEPKTFTTVKFYHGLGDCANFARLIPLYVRRGHKIGVECTPDKRILFRAAGAEIVEQAQHTHGWGYPPFDVHAGHGHDHRGSKSGWNISEPPLPDIGDKAELWPEYCETKVRVAPLIPASEREFITRWLAALPRPIVLLHSKGNTNQGVKSLPDPIAGLYYRELLDRFDGTLVLLDWDNRVPRMSHYRVRHLNDMPGGCPTERLFTLIEQADLIVGVDSGPLHAAGLTDTPRVGIWMPRHYAARYSLPDPGQLNLVLAAHTYQWNRYRRIPWHIVEQPGTEYDPAWLAEQTVPMLRPPRYLPPQHRAADVQLQQWIDTLCSGPKVITAGTYADRNRSFDLLLRETSRRFREPTVVETGTIRSEEDWGGAGFFTYLAGAFLHRHGGKLHSVDLDPTNCRFASTWCAPFGESVQVHCADSVAFLQQFGRPIDVLYLDSLDTYQPGHAEHGLNEVRAALPCLHERSLIVFDDTPWSSGAFTGKGAQAVPWLMERGWHVLYGGYQVVLGRRIA